MANGFISTIEMLTLKILVKVCGMNCIGDYFFRISRQMSLAKLEVSRCMILHNLLHHRFAVFQYTIM